MFEKTNVKNLGVVENMAYFQPPGGGDPIALFPKGELDQYLDSKGIEKLAQIPFNPNIGLTGEAGMPVVESYPESIEAQAFMKLARQVLGSRS